MKTIGIVDDELEMEEVYSLLLAPLLADGMVNVEFFSSARQFLEWQKDHQGPDLLLCDINMPEMDGVDLCHHLREVGQSFPIFFVSGHNSLEYENQMDSLSISRFLSKPLTTAEVVAACENEIGFLPANS